MITPQQSRDLRRLRELREQPAFNGAVERIAGCVNVDRIFDGSEAAEALEQVVKLLSGEE